MLLNAAFIVLVLDFVTVAALGHVLALHALLKPPRGDDLPALSQEAPEPVEPDSLLSNSQIEQKQAA